MLDLNVAETRLLIAVFDRAALGLDGSVRDAGWLDTANGLREAVAKIGSQAGFTSSDPEIGVYAGVDGVTMNLDPGIIPQVRNEIEAAIPTLLGPEWYRVAEQLSANAADLAGRGAFDDAF